MKNIILTSCLIFLFANTKGQSTIVGAWITQGKGYELSVFIKEDGIIKMQKDPKQDINAAKNMRTGKYLYEKSQIIISWDDNATESWKIKKLDDNAMVIDKVSQKRRIKNIVLHKVRDEEVIVN